jgi:hypothetical protein
VVGSGISEDDNASGQCACVQQHGAARIALSLVINQIGGCRLKVLLKYCKVKRAIEYGTLLLTRGKLRSDIHLQSWADIALQGKTLSTRIEKQKVVTHKINWRSSTASLSSVREYHERFFVGMGTIRCGFYNDIP